MNNMRKSRAALNANWAVRVLISWAIVIAALTATVGIMTRF